mmetsp:Transcript_22942/g.25464  ORF Transcript_22942/g.25464 Transcript_22942/m.25464 type:complete len:734 (+) Transcript_22942:27-2228(+)|eukprot:CAMPEP_0205830074 /NCGR_PEP_ID=MMETSP0206-20130828/39967_1 /ASSEMBLY_ACC=CAM_ASM_000279 /TAXON_ID=36767 /ORGANISM="Euplotes focardii, Strain TN1" /LENGTH=733 /DNA_ID=CAMNT_0053133361 /DNA_START=27 /DNA_END=2228 /DNA_ORIENTATION=+
MSESELRQRKEGKNEDTPEGEEDGGAKGYVGDVEFIVPATFNTVQAMLPQNMSYGSALTWTIFLINCFLTFYVKAPKWVNITIFLFWRLCYNVGLGVILNGQSINKTFGNLYEEHTAKDTPLSRLLKRLAKGSLRDKALDINSYPKPFQAWLLYKNLVNLVLMSDVASYVLLGIACAHQPKSWTFLVCAQYFVGLCLCGFNYWAKVDAHRCIGEYCWYWGDFFFRKDLKLTFDGIFELFPHPMYTVGYSLYYGYSLITRSYTVLFVSITAHLLQIGFLMFVEEPHIERTYGGAVPIDKSKIRVLYDPQSGFFPRDKETKFLLHVDLFRSGDFALVVFVTYGILFSLTVTNPMWCVVQVLAWRIFHWGGLGYVLWGQGRRELWTRHYTSRGRTLYEAFAHWKQIYNLSVTMNVAVFIGCALRHIEWEWRDLVTVPGAGSLWMCMVLGVVLLGLNLWTSISTYKAVGDFGWFYGDFFISHDIYKHHLCYTGVYRFLNNPDCVTGYAGFYGAALATQSWTIFVVAAMSQLANIVFLHVVEAPHMKRLYEKKEIRGNPPIARKLKGISREAQGALRDVLPVDNAEQERTLSELKLQAKKIQRKAVQEVFDIYQRLKRERRMSTSQEPETTLSAPDSLMIGEELVVQFKTAPDHSDTDWIGVYHSSVESRPGNSDGKWMFVPPGCEGTVRFPASMLPHSPGVYEIRYHRDGMYQVLNSTPLLLEESVKKAVHDELKLE